MTQAFFSADPNRVIAIGADGVERIGPVNAAQVPRWAGPATFARLPRLDQVEKADIVVAGSAVFGSENPRETIARLASF